MHLLIIILQQLLGMLPGAKKAPQAEVVRPRRPDPAGSDPASCLRLGTAMNEWVTVVKPNAALLRGEPGERRRPIAYPPPETMAYPNVSTTSVHHPRGRERD